MSFIYYFSKSDAITEMDFDYGVRYINGGNSGPIINGFNSNLSSSGAGNAENIGDDYIEHSVDINNAFGESTSVRSDGSSCNEFTVKNSKVTANKSITSDVSGPSKSTESGEEPYFEDLGPFNSMSLNKYSMRYRFYMNWLGCYNEYLQMYNYIIHSNRYQIRK